jgi:hypothetical protein
MYKYIIKKLIRKIFFITLPIIVIFIFLSCYIFFIIVQTELGFNEFGAGKLYLQSMQDGDAKHALYWIEKSIKYHKMPLSKKERNYLKIESEIKRAYAIELDKRYEETMLIFNTYLKHPDADFARIYYKLGKKKDSFEEYCNWLYSIDDGRPLLSYIEHYVLLNDGYRIHLSPFNKYDDFMNFMEQEYKTLEMTPKYQRAMLLFKGVAIDIEVKYKQN